MSIHQPVACMALVKLSTSSICNVNLNICTKYQSELGSESVI